MEKHWDIAVIGGGPAGYVAAIRGAQLGKKVILFEEDVVGGTCLNRGCIPTKTYLKTAEALKEIAGASERGILLDAQPRVDMSAALAHKNKVVKTLTNGVSSLLRTNGVSVVKGQACLSGARSVLCGEQEYDADAILLCGGSEPSLPPIPGIQGRDVVTSTELLASDQIPERLCIIGGGVIGCELATVFRTFGSKVCIVEQAQCLAPMFEEDISEVVEQCLKRDGVSIYTGCSVEKIETRKTDSLAFFAGTEFCCDRILVATGRRPNLSCLGSMKGKVELHQGQITVDDYMETNVSGIYACGDLTGKMMLTHAAFYMGRIAAENCAGARVRCDLHTTPNCMYAEPEIASVGMTEKEAVGQFGDRVVTGKFRIGANGRAIASGEQDGFVKVVADRVSGELLGTHIVGYMANELIGEAIAVMEGEMTIRQVANRMVQPHPSFGEAFYEACLDALGRSIHQPPRKK